MGQLTPAGSSSSLRHGRLNNGLMEEPERGLPRTESGPRPSHEYRRPLGRRATASGFECGKAAQKQRQKPSIFVAGSQVLRLLGGISSMATLETGDAMDSETSQPTPMYRENSKSIDDRVPDPA
jgi:hypothetical protein